MSEEYEYLVPRLSEDAGEPGTAPARARLARRQAELLSALVAGGPLPPGFDAGQVRVQAGGLAAKRRESVARVAPELPVLLGGRFGPAFRRYTAATPPTGGHRADAVAFAAWVLCHEEGLTAGQRRGLARWHADRTGTAPRGAVLARLRAPLESIGRRARRSGGGH